MHHYRHRLGFSLASLMTRDTEGPREGGNLRICIAYSCDYWLLHGSFAPVYPWTLNSDSLVGMKAPRWSHDPWLGFKNPRLVESLLGPWKATRIAESLGPSLAHVCLVHLSDVVCPFENAWSLGCLFLLGPLSHPGSKRNVQVYQEYLLPHPGARLTFSPRTRDDLLLPHCAILYDVFGSAELIFALNALPSWMLLPPLSTKGTLSYPGRESS
eukprot:Gb_40578 [translate_table: standard]